MVVPFSVDGDTGTACDTGKVLLVSDASFKKIARRLKREMGT